jgi:hypothetical protein
MDELFTSGDPTNEQLYGPTQLSEGQSFKASTPKTTNEKLPLSRVLITDDNAINRKVTWHGERFSTNAYSY